MLEYRNLYARYGKLEALKDISIRFQDGEIAAILGHNGAGKTTLLKCGVGEHIDLSGQVIFRNQRIVPGEVHNNVRLGLGFVPQENNVFGDLPVHENLRIAGLRIGSFNLDNVYELFPRLGERKDQLARSLSGGERQMLALGMALITRPFVLFLDEPTTGLAPLLVQAVLKTVRHINETMSVTTLIVEQNVQVVLKVVNRAVVIKMGRIAFDGAVEEILAKEDLWGLF